VYNTYEIDSAGNEEVISLNDTVKVIGDSIIDGITYAKILKKEYGFSPRLEVFLRRDSPGYIVNEKGNILFSQNDFNDTLFSQIIGTPEKPYMHWWYMMEEYSENVILPVGQFNSVLNRKQTLIYLQEPNQPIKYLNNFYAPNIGPLTNQYAYTSSLLKEKKYYEERLIDYQIPVIIE